MSHLGYCPKCKTKIIEAKTLGAFDDFTIKCCNCKRLVNIVDIRFVKSTVDDNKESMYNVGSIFKS